MEKGKLDEDAERAALDRLATSTASARRPRRRRRHRGGDRERGAEAEHLPGAATRWCRPGGVLATNTSSIPITRIAAATKRPDAVIGMHFMNPVPVMKLVELIRGAATSDETYAAHPRRWPRRWARRVVTSRDYPGFIVNRILIPMLNEACLRADGGPRHGRGHRHRDEARHQPADGAAAARRLHRPRHRASPSPRCCTEGLGDAKYRPCPLLRQYVDAGWLGKKTGRGFYEYER